MKKYLVALLLFTSIFTTNVFAKSSDFNLLGSGTVFKLNPITDGILAGTGLALNGTWLLCDKILDLKTAQFSGGLSDKNNINSFDKLFFNKYNKPFDTTADGLLATMIITPVFLAVTPNEEWFTIGTMYVEALLLANGIKEITKLAVNRERPYMYFSGYPADALKDGDWCKSFPSGHTTITFTCASFSTYTFWKYFPDSPWRFVVLGAGFSLATTTGIFRIISGNHFMTDVITGAILGTTCGLVVPWLHTLNINKNTDKTQISILPSGISVAIKF